MKLLNVYTVIKCKLYMFYALSCMAAPEKDRGQDDSRDIP